MGLGNNMSMGKARGKAKPVMVRRMKEVLDASSYTEIQGSAVQGSAACSQTTLNVTYYHDGSHVSGLPLNAGDKLYTRKRLNSRFYPANGHIKVGPDRGRYSNIEVTDGAVRAPGGIVCP
tara:strand:- start:1067 stop:1426 length:360 start_codon:yes stop_codon:yes gene_type:complete